MTKPRLAASTGPETPRPPRSRQPQRALVAGAMTVLLVAILSACNTVDRLTQVGKEPPLSAIRDPAELHGKAPIMMPQPAPVTAARQPNSLWRPGSRVFLKDQRASQVGDILTVVIEIDDGASIANTSSRSRANSEDAAASHLLGFESGLNEILPSAVDPGNLIDFGSNSSSQGSGSVNRDETIDLRIAALVTQVLPNGNLVIAGRQEIRVNFEVRELQLVGLIRPEDITSANTVSYDQIAEARIAYGGRGQITDVQQPRYAQQIFDIIWPF